MVGTEKIMDTLGVPQRLKRTRVSWDALHELILGGLPFSTYTHLVTIFQLTPPEAAAIFHIPARTLARRRGRQRLPPQESDRVFRFARIAAQASDILGSNEKAGRWFHRSNRALGNKPPVSLLGTDAGIEQIEIVLGRLEHGVYS